MNFSEVFENDSYKKVIVKKAVPQMSALFLIAAFFLLDTVFSARLGENELMIVSISEPICNLSNAIFLGMAVIFGSVVSNLLGSNEYENMGSVFFSYSVLGVAVWIIMLVTLLPISMWLFSVNILDPSNLHLIEEYLALFIASSILSFFCFSFESLFLSVGLSFMSSVIKTLSTVVKVIFEPLFMFGLLGFPKLGIIGIPVSTAIAFLVCIAVSILVTMKKKVLLRPFIKLDFRLMKKILRLFPPISFTKMLEPLGNFVVMLILLRYSSLFVIFYSFYVKLQRMVTMPVDGFCRAYTCVAGFFNGKKDIVLLRKTLNFVIRSMIAFAVVSSILIFLFRGKLINLIQVDLNNVSDGTISLGILCWAIITASLNKVFDNFFQATLKPGYSLTLIMLEYALFLIPILVIFINHIGAPMFWTAFVISGLLVSIVGFIMVRHILNMKDKAYSITKESKL